MRVGSETDALLFPPQIIRLIFNAVNDGLLIVEWAMLLVGSSQAGFGIGVTTYALWLFYILQQTCDYLEYICGRYDG